MNMKDLQKKVENFVKKYNLKHSPEINTLDLVAEVGEIAKEILESTNYGKKKAKASKKIKLEIGDAFYSLINLANSLNIDLEEALELVLQKYKERFKKGGSVGSDE